MKKVSLAQKKFWPLRIYRDYRRFGPTQATRRHKHSDVRFIPLRYNPDRHIVRFASQEVVMPICQTSIPNAVSQECDVTSFVQNASKISPTVDDLVLRAVEDHDAHGVYIYAPNMLADVARSRAASALSAAIEDWCADNHRPLSAVPIDMWFAAVSRIEDSGWAARERQSRVQMNWDMENGIITGAARHEARRELEGA